MRIAIIGAGFSGCQLTLELLRRARPGTQILLFDGAATFGRGIAFAARHDRLLLNVRVANMSAFEDDRSHFLRWLWANDLPGHPTDPIPPSGHAFVPRGLYGRYLSELLDEAAAALPSGVSLRRVAHDVVEVGEEHERVRLGLDDGGVQTADIAVLCSGMLRPVLPPAPSDAEQSAGPRLITNPWDEAAIARVGPEDAVLVLGTGLTMIDVVTMLADAGHRGPILALSRHGLLPRVHAPTRAWSLLAPPTEIAPSVGALMRFIRREIRRARAAGFDWRDVLDALRPHTQRLWQRLPQAERRRFLRHVRAYWEVHRHRMAPEIAARVDDLRRSGRLEVRAGTIAAYQWSAEGIGIRFRSRGSAADRRIMADWLVNCAGPTLDFRGVRNPLVRSLLKRGLACPDPLGLGLRVNPDLRLIRPDGRANERLFAVGPITKGTFWETTAVPDIRVQGRKLATQLLGEDMASAA
jgi:uncharacterized NAD(P)/FAD-binding protein YdhS